MVSGEVVFLSSPFHMATFLVEKTSTYLDHEKEAVPDYGFSPRKIKNFISYRSILGTFGYFSQETVFTTPCLSYLHYRFPVLA